MWFLLLKQMDWITVSLLKTAMTSMSMLHVLCCATKGCIPLPVLMLTFVWCCMQFQKPSVLFVVSAVLTCLLFFYSFHQPCWCYIIFLQRVQSSCRQHSWFPACSSLSGNHIYRPVMSEQLQLNILFPVFDVLHCFVIKMLFPSF